MSARVPWYLWASIASVSCILIGGYWDISWHMTIGRDTFWTPAHLAIQLGGIIAGATGTYLILSTTLRRTGPMRDASVGVWGFRGPLGAFVAVWGAATMLISAPFDNWWHNAYGLDVKILSPPHMVLTFGILGVSAGAVLLVVASLNRADAALRRRLELVMLLVGAEVLILGMTSVLEFTFRSNLHRADAYRAVSLVAPVGMFSFSRVSQRRWATTIVAGAYTAFMVGMVWLFPLFPAVAKLGPVYQPITHYIPLEFPALIIAPAIACDLILARTAAWPRWRVAPLLGVVFVAVFVAVEWPFADFLVSDGARNWVFGAHYMPYFMRPEWYEARGVFMPESDLAMGLAKAAIGAMVASYLGLAAGDLMRKARR